MDLRGEVMMVMQSRAGHALTVDQVAAAVAEKIKEEIRLILNGLVDAGELASVHGGGGYKTTYLKEPIPRRL